MKTFFVGPTPKPGEIIVDSPIMRRGEVIGTYRHVTTPEAAEACRIPARGSQPDTPATPTPITQTATLQIDLEKAARIREDSDALMKRLFGIER